MRHADVAFTVLCFCGIMQLLATERFLDEKSLGVRSFVRRHRVVPEGVHEGK